MTEDKQTESRANKDDQGGLVKLGNRIRQIRQMKKVTQATLVRKTGLRKTDISRLENGNLKPTAEMVTKISDALGLPHEDKRELLALAGYSELPPQDGGYTIPRPLDSNMLREKGAQYQTNESPNLQIPIEDLRDAITDLVEELKPALTENQSSTIAAEIENIKSTIDVIQSTSEELTAPVRVPPREMMEVQLVPTTTLEKLEEYRSDENIWFSATGISIGAVLAILINLATGGQSDTSTWIIMALLIAVGTLTSWAAITYRQRGNQAKRQIFEQHRERDGSGG